MPKKFLIANLVFLAIIALLIEGVSYVVIKGKLGEFDLPTQGGTTMVQSAYQVWEHPENYKSWSTKTQFNNLGLRRRADLTEQKPDDVVRIVLMGGSAAFGSQAMPGSMFLQISGQGEYQNEETITAYLEQMLNEKYEGKTFEVINAATNWSRLHQQMLHYLRKIRALEPDLILSMDAYNDSSPLSSSTTWLDTQILGDNQLFGNLKHKISPIFQSSHTAYLLAMMIFRTGAAPAPDQTLIEKYTAITKPRNFETLLGQSRIEAADMLQKMVHEYTSNLRYFDAILDQDGVAHSFYLQPLTILDNTKQLTPVEQAIQGFQYDTLDAGQLLRINFYRDLEHEGKKLEDDGVLDFESMLSVFAGEDETLYSDYCHFTPKGNELLAAYFMKEIETKHPQLLQ